ncbi:MAG: marine proteobacterial sortase target protein [Woeseiaceae bacterium]
MAQNRAANGINAKWQPCGGRSSWHPGVNPGMRTTMSATIKAKLHRQPARRWLPFLLLLLFANMAPAQDEISDVTPGQMQAGSLLLKMKSGYVVATRMNTEIKASMSGLVARVSVKQEFRNTGSEWVEGVYVFPLPDGAAVDQLRMHIGERFIEGEVREKAEAKKAYETAKEAGKKASLVRQERANMFTTSVANIAPGETVRIEIEYLETLRIDEGNFSIRFPVAITPRYIPGTPLPGRKGSGWSPDTDAVHDASLITPPVVTRSDDHKLTFSAELNAGVPLEYIASRYHPIAVDNSNNRYAIELTQSDTPMDHDVELTWKPVSDSAPRAMLFTERIDDDPYALLMMLPPDDVSGPAQSTPRELQLVIDTSGSMHGTSLDQAKRALILALDGLRPDDRFNVIQFNSNTSVLFQDSVVASTANLATAKRYVAGLAANGGTEMQSAIQTALNAAGTETHLRQVIFITDGSVGNEDALFSLIENRLGNARLFTVGIGSAPNSWFMRKAAEAGRGTFTLISALHEVNEKMERLFRKIERPQLTDITIQWPDGILASSYPATVPDLYAGEPVFIRAQLSHVARDSDMVVIRGNSAAGSWEAELPIMTGLVSPGVGALWARARIEDLLDRRRRGADEETTRKSVIQTALAHHLVSKFTSLVAIDKTPVRPTSAALNSEQVPGLLPYGQSTEAIFGFPATATSAGAYRLNGLKLLMLGVLLLTLLRRRPGSDEQVLQ